MLTMLIMKAPYMKNKICTLYNLYLVPSIRTESLSWNEKSSI